MDDGQDYSDAEIEKFSSEISSDYPGLTDFLEFISSDCEEKCSLECLQADKCSYRKRS